jgi:hypothetical protein
VAQAKKALDLAVYQHALATALADVGETAEAERLLVIVTEALRGPKFANLQRDAARTESFEVYSSARGDVAAYVSLLNRTQLRLATLYERRGAADQARREYERVLASRSDDATALAALARLATSDAERERRYAEAFDANPFSMTLVREYQRHQHVLPSDGGTSTGTEVRRALVQLQRGETRAARTTLDALLAKFPANETLRMLRRQAQREAPSALPGPNPTAAELRQLLETFERLTPEQRVQLDQASFTSVVRFGEPFESGTIDGVPFRFAERTQFAGTFDAAAPLRLTYRISGVTKLGDADALLLEPLRLEAVR